MKALTAAEMREVDRLTAERFGIPSLQLMEAAGKHVADAVMREFSPGLLRRVTVLCGKGNNGGDGLVAARLLKEGGLNPRVCLFAKREDLRGDAAANLEQWLKLTNEIAEITDASAWERVWPQVAKSHVIVDALLGTGLRGAATGMVSRTIERLNQLSGNATRVSPALILAVDTPSGLPSDGQPADGPVLRAHLTITFTAPKVGQLVSRDAACTGQILVRSIGSPKTLVEEVGQGTLRWSGPDEFQEMPLVRAANSHKGSFGHVLLLAGSLGKSGAAILAGQAALRAGAGLVTVATPDVAQTVVAAGTHPETQQFIRHLVQHSALPIVLDADGLNAFALRPDALHQRKSPFLCVTPHPGEMARLLGTTSASVQQDRIKTAVDAARRWNAYVVLKSFHTVLASPTGKVFVNTTGNAGLAKGGSGDVLTGLLAAVTAQFGAEDWLRVLALGVYLHGNAAVMLDRAGDQSGLVAQEIANALPSARASLIQEIRFGA